MRIKFSGITDIGAVRSNNEDNLLLLGSHYRDDTESSSFSYSSTCDEKSQLYAVCDGMGGASKGEMASLLAVKSLSEFYPYNKFDSDKDRIFDKLNQTVLNYSLDNNLSVCGTTIVLFHLYRGKARLYNIGDSEGFIYRDGKLTKLSYDDTVYQMYHDLGINISFGRNMLTQYLGVNPDEIMLNPHISDEYKLKKGDILLLNSDGVTNSVRLDEIEEILASKKDISEKSAEIIKLCNEKECNDNVTVVLIEVEKS